LGAAPPFQPNRRGFDYFYGFLDGGHQYMPGEVSIHADGYWEPLLRNAKPTPFTEYLTTALSRDAARYVSTASRKPFFVYLSYNAPHTPLQAPKSFIDKYQHIADPERRVYAAMIDAMDEGIGMLVAALKAANQYDNTLIFFLSDNGGVYPEAWQPTSDWSDNAPFRRGKVALLEGGIRVPFIAHWQSAFRAGRP
jgi:arylsulfatase A-like enzyme